MQTMQSTIRRTTRFNTASGIDCMQLGVTEDESKVAWIEVSIPQAVWIACNLVKEAAKRTDVLFQYRKRYGLHAIARRLAENTVDGSFNTASGMDCMQ